MPDAPADCDPCSLSDPDPAAPPPAAPLPDEAPPDEDALPVLPDAPDEDPEALPEPEGGVGMGVGMDTLGDWDGVGGVGIELDELAQPASASAARAATQGRSESRQVMS